MTPSTGRLPPQGGPLQRAAPSTERLAPQVLEPIGECWLRWRSGTAGASDFVVLAVALVALVLLAVVVQAVVMLVVVSRFPARARLRGGALSARTSPVSSR
eukprot:6291101-Alexandrium_andersonii.AAC.1